LDFEIAGEFFECFEKSEIETGKLEVKVVLNKKPQLLELNVRIEGYVQVICDKCLDTFNMPLKYSDDLYVKFGESYEEIDEKVIVLKENSHNLNLSQFLYEYIHLSIPYRRVHPNDEKGNSTCNAEMLSQIQEHSFEEEKHEEIDPRWKGLIDFKNDKN
jgi:uncharacterized metal-binding protein YceD (DUF177 family)